MKTASMHAKIHNLVQTQAQSSSSACACASFMSCGNKTLHKQKEIYYIWPIKTLVPDSLNLT